MKNIWFALTLMCLLWYSLVTLYVAFKGFGDIKEMLSNLKKKKHLRE